jgi:hypothetical protein
MPSALRRLSRTLNANGIPKALPAILLGVLVLTLLLSLAEISWLFLLRHPSTIGHLPSGLSRLISSQYSKHDRNIIQFMPECSRYDETLTYTLRPGRCTFSNVEFNVDFRINSLGVRDDEDSMISPEVIVLGDSHAMGWGIEQDKTFSEIIERKSGLKVLNCSVSSYGTAREILLMDRADTDSLRYLIVQYSNNDFRENLYFFEDGNTDRAGYESELKAHHANSRYFFGKHVIRLFQGLLPVPKGKAKTASARKVPDDDELEAETFINTLLESGVDLSGVRIIVLEIAGYGNNDSDFVNALKDLISSRRFPDHIENMVVLDISEILSDRDYFIIDDHANEQGHEKIAEAMVPLIKGLGNTDTGK